MKNGIIYAATSAPDGGIWRWTIGQSTLWEQIDESITALNTGQRVSGLRIGGRGALYALRREAVNGGSGGVSRSLNPAETAPARIEFEGANSGLPVSAAFDPTAVYSHTLPYLKLSGGAGQDDLWSIDTATQTIYQFQDSLSQIAPTLREPANGAVIPVNTRDGGIYPAFGWEEQPGVTQYEVAVYLDPKATQIVWSGTSTTEALAVTSGNKLPQTSPGTIYYWRVRASEPVKSLWSETMSMAGELANAWSPLVLSTPAPGARDVAIRPTFAWNSVDGAKGYELMLARDSGFNDVVAAMTGKNALTRTFWVCDRDLDFAATYYWQVRATGVNSRSQWVTGAFTTAEKPAVESPSIVVQPAPTSSVPSPPPAPSMTAETLVPVSILWVAIGIGGALVIVVLGLIVIRGR